MTSRIDDISQARLCERCHRWGPEEATFCGQCGLQLRPLPFAPVPGFDEDRRRRRRRRLIAAQSFGWAGLLGTLIGERIRDSRDEDRRGW